MTEELARRGRATNRKRVERLMQTHGTVRVHKPAKVRTTIPVEDAPPLPDLTRCVGLLDDRSLLRHTDHFPPFGSCANGRQGPLYWLATGELSGGDRARDGISGDRLTS